MLDLQIQIRRMPKPVVAMVAGYAIGGGHVLHVVCDLTIAADNARFGQTGPKVGSFDGGYGSGLLARIVGQKKAREIWFLCDQYDAQQALDMGLVNTVVPLADLERETVAWCRKMLQLSPIALRMVKASPASCWMPGQAVVGRVHRRLEHPQRDAATARASRGTTATVSLSSSASGTTVLTEPMSSACCASYWRHRNQISRAFFWPTMRASRPEP